MKGAKLTTVFYLIFLVTSSLHTDEVINSFQGTCTQVQTDPLFQHIGGNTSISPRSMYNGSFSQIIDLKNGKVAKRINITTPSELKKAATEVAILTKSHQFYDIISIGQEDCTFFILKENPNAKNNDEVTNVILQIK